jgi:DNA polymerase III delta prime subunit
MEKEALEKEAFDKEILRKENKESLFLNKYQPLFLDDFGIDNELSQMLKSFITLDSLNVMLFGEMASGKTSLLNAMIKEYYKGYSPKEYENNVLYINSLKEQGINYYRTDVKTFCQTCSAIKNKKKIIVLDDLDMINEQSQQVFRNCLDKFSKNIHFISSCSNLQKVIESLQSRFNIIKLKPMKRENLLFILDKIKNAENISIDPDAEDFIVSVSNSTIKILINYMEKFRLLGVNKITLSLAQQLCTNISFIIFEEFTELIKQKELNKAIQLIYSVYDKGYSVMDILDNYFIFIKTTSLLSEDEKYDIVSVICKYITIFHNIHEDEIELALFTNNLLSIMQK